MIVVRPAGAPSAISAARSATGADRLNPSFDEVYERWFHETCRFLRSAGVPDADLEDVAQEAFIVVHRKLASFDGGNLGGWLYQIARRTASDYRRRAWFRNLFQRRQDLDEGRDLGAAPDPARLLEEAQVRWLVRASLSRLPLKQRMALTLFEFEGYSIAEIAALEGVPEATVRTRLHYGRREFREQLARRDPLAPPDEAGPAPTGGKRR